jgi:hypothetical protein
LFTTEDGQVKLGYDSCLPDVIKTAAEIMGEIGEVGLLQTNRLWLLKGIGVIKVAGVTRDKIIRVTGVISVY